MELNKESKPVKWLVYSECDQFGAWHDIFEAESSSDACEKARSKNGSMLEWPEAYMTGDGKFFVSDHQGGYLPVETTTIKVLEQWRTEIKKRGYTVSDWTRMRTIPTEIK